MISWADLQARWDAWSVQQKLVAGGAVAAAVLLLAVAGVAAAVGDGDEPDEVVFETATATASPAATRTPAPATPEGTGVSAGTEGTVHPSPADALGDLRELIAEYGYPPDTDYAEMRIPVLGVDAQVGARYVGADGVMPAPGGPADVVWYDMSAWPGMGGAPGEGGNAIFAAHVDYAYTIPYAGVYYRGQGVFSQLKALQQGDIIEIERNGETLRYEVAWQQQMDAHTTSWAPIWSSDQGVDAITLYTCGGAFDSVTATYSDRIVVRAHRIS